MQFQKLGELCKRHEATLIADTIGVFAIALIFVAALHLPTFA